MVRQARAQIAEGGVSHVNLNEVLRLSGGSKATLAKYFGDKNGLIAAAIAEEAREAMAALRRGPAQPDSQTLQEALCALLAGVLRFYLSPSALRVYRAVIAVGGTTAEAFYRQGHQAVVDEVASFLSAWLGKGLRSELDVQHAAEQLTHMIRAGSYERALLGIGPERIDQEAIAETAKFAVDLFLQGAAQR